jgi:hypothetical protein
MAKKIELNKQTLRVLSSEEMEAVAGGALAAELPLTPTGCHTTSDVCVATMVVVPTTTETDPNA